MADGTVGDDVAVPGEAVSLISHDPKKCAFDFSRWNSRRA